MCSRQGRPSLLYHRTVRERVSILAILERIENLGVGLPCTGDWVKPRRLAPDGTYFVTLPVPCQLAWQERKVR